MLASVPTYALDGVDGREVTVEVDVRRGLPAFAIVGLPDASVRESRERVRAGLLNAGLDFPLQRITANLAPASVRKAGPGFDLAIALGVLLASGQVDPDHARGLALCAELSLGGALRPVRGALAAAIGARTSGHARIVVARENGEEAALVEGLEVVALETVGDLFEYLHGRFEPPPVTAVAEGADRGPGVPDMAEVRGQADAKRALEIAAAGGHNVLMVGPPGAGKTMIARRLPGLLPPPTFDEALEITRIHSIAGTGGRGLAQARPFRSPHHTVSAQGLVGGGVPPRPGEITLAHRGVLFLDELAEFSRPALEALRQPLEDGLVDIIRGQRSVRFPAQAMLVAACNPCPCGAVGSSCRCGEADRARYQRRLSGPLIDRIDLVCQVAGASAAELVGARRLSSEGSDAVRARVVSARERQRHRLDGTRSRCNGDMDGALTRRLCPVADSGAARLVDGIERGGLSGRGHDRVLRLARTIADLDGREAIIAADLDEALGYRMSAPTAVAA